MFAICCIKDCYNYRKHKMCLTNLLLLHIVAGTSLQEIKVDCDIDDRASISITKKGKVWEVS